MDIGSKVRWLGANPEGWAGPGIGQIISYDPSRIGFVGNRVGPGEPPRGPAIQIQLDHNGLCQWLSPIEVEEVHEEEEHESDA